MFWFKKTNKEILTTRGEIMNLFFQEFILQISFGQTPRQFLNKSYSIRIQID